jgi:LmbE family N-acetylglucosaminyl deacetylase
MLMMTGCSQKPSLEELKKLAATETFPEDNYLDTVSNKKALIIVAHDDDDCAMPGTIAKLKAEGWQIKQLSLVSHKPGNDHPATIICEGNELILADGLYRTGLDTMKYPYVPIPKEEMEKQFLREKITQALLNKVNNFEPSVIFTLDNEMGGYGHPEHIFISRLVFDLFNTKEIRAQRIYQSVFTNHMEKEIVDTWLYNKMKNSGYPNASEMAKTMYQLKDGMPEPTVQVNITAQAETKMAYLLAYPESVRKNLRKFIPYFQEFDAKTYFSVFDREFFRVIE